MDKPRVYVDFNKMIDADIVVLLSKNDIAIDNAGNEILLREGKRIDIYMEDADSDGERDDLIASGIVEKNETGAFPMFRWNCRIDANGIRHESDVIS